MSFRTLGTAVRLGNTSRISIKSANLGGSVSLSRKTRHHTGCKCVDCSTQPFGVQTRNFWSGPGKDGLSDFFSSTKEIFQQSSDALTTFLITNGTTSTVAAAATEAAASDELGTWTSLIQAGVVGAQHMTGLPWWETIALLTIGTRLVLLPASAWQMKKTSLLTKVKPIAEVHMAKMKEHRANGDQALAMEEAQKMSQVYKQHGVNPFAPMVVPIVQIPIFAGAFFALRHLADHSEVLKTGGLFWFTDMSVPDPFYILPIAASAVMLLTVELGGEVPLPPEQQKSSKLMMRAMSAGMLFVTINMPSAVLVFWLTNSIYSLFQSLFFRSKLGKKMFGLPDLRASAAAAAAAKPANTTVATPTITFVKKENLRSFKDEKKQ